jgi:low affinity Fe/Cu permease
MVFLIQLAQNKESRALQLNLNEIVAALEGASNRLVNVEDLSEADLAILRSHYERLSRVAARDGSLTESHSVDEAEARHDRKSRKQKTSPRKSGTSHAVSDSKTGNGPRGAD